MHILTINGYTTSVKTLTAAREAITTAAQAATVSLSKPINPKLYASPKVAQAVKASNHHSIKKLANLTLPRKLEPFEIKINGLRAFFTPASK